MSLPQSSATAHSSGQGSIPNQTSASDGSSLPMNTLPNISVVDSYSITSATDTPVQNLGAGPSNNGSHNTALQGIKSWYYPVVSSQPAFVSPPGNFTFGGRQLPPLSPQYGTPVMMLGTSWGQQSPYQGFQAPWPVNLGMQQVGNATNNTVARNAQETNQFQLQNAAFPQQVLPMQHQQGSVVVLSQLSGQEGVPRLTYIPQGTTDVGVQGTAGVTINQGPVGTGNNQGAIGENARQAGQHVQATNDRHFILYQNRVPGNNTVAANLDDPHIPQGSGVVVAVAPDADVVQKETRLDPEQEKLRAVSDAILNALNQNQQHSLQHQGQEDRRSQLWGKGDMFFPPKDMFFPPINMVYMLLKTFCLKEPATATTIIPKAVADTDGPEIIATDASPFATQANAVEAYYYNNEVGPYRLIGMDKYGRPQQATMRRDMSLPEWKLLLQEVNRPYNYNVLRPLLAAPSIEEVSNEDN
ncbi:OLC1v1018731C1 [Oldenlandia corymbosa var. corymbosa]|uniref:OLC1v1018731C1 n=1 Tax=Oldenlandia corymbosa var. corymbosa TaxID=529605 RepID=A0AAV1ECE5_OLDCO|nr:OLC1v1018731C1 [Oldenlandia corymbosa var. corymbosa]